MRHAGSVSGARTPSRTPRGRVSTPLLVLVVTVLVAALCPVLWKTVEISRDEAELSARIRPLGGGVPAPVVMFTGSPFGARTPVDEGLRYPGVRIRVARVPRPLVGPVTVTLTADDVLIPTDRHAPVIAHGARVAVLIGGDALGRALGDRDVLLSNDDDSSLAGRPEELARIGYAGHDGGPAPTVRVRLVCDEHGARLVPEDPAPPGAEPRGIVFPPDLLPLGARVDSLSIHGGTITASGPVPDPHLYPAELAAGGRR